MLSTNRTTTSRTTSGASWQSCIRERQSSKAITGLLTWTHSCARRNARSFMRLRCSITSRQTGWAPGRAPRPSVENSWVNILWQGKLLDVIFITYTQGCYPSRHYWIIADDKQVAGDFFAAVCDWSSEVRGEVLIFQDGEWVKSRRLYDAIKSATFDNLILRDGLKQEIQNDFAQFFQSRDVYERYRILEDLDSMI